MKSSTNKSSPRERLLAAAGDLFRSQGIRGVGVEAIAAAAGTNKMTLYRHFTSKDELVAAWIQILAGQSDKLWNDIAERHPGRGPAIARARLLCWIHYVAAKVCEPEARGCPFANSVAELPEKDHPARRVIEEHQQRMRARMVRLCRAAGLREPAVAADELFFLLEGARVSAQNLGARRVAQQLPSMAAALIAARSVAARSVAARSDKIPTGSKSGLGRRL